MNKDRESIQHFIDYVIVKDLERNNMYECMESYLTHTSQGQPLPIDNVSGSDLLIEVLMCQKEIISNPIRFNGVSIEDVKRIFAKHGIKYEPPF